ncbi:restriction endonuclease subunit S [Lachnobacterium bovis]
MGIKINLPSIHEQQQIANYLRQLDNLITLHRRV